MSQTSSLKKNLDSFISVAEKDAIKEEVSGPENLIACGESNTDRLRNDIRCVKLESEISK